MTDQPARPHIKPTLCPICHRPSVAAHRPFCSPRCADVDLGHWFSEVYRVPAEEEDSTAG